MHGITGMSARAIKNIFEEETRAAGGTLRECRVFKGWVYAKSLLPRLSEILPGDHVQAGVVIRSTLRRATGQHVGELSANQLRSFALHVRLSGRAAEVIAERFNAGSDRSRYGLMNAITSVARDSDDPELRWNLEKFGGDVAFTRVLIPTREQTCQAAAA